MGIQEKIKDIELEMSRTQKNKATEGHLGLLKAKLAKLRTQLLEPTSKVSLNPIALDLLCFSGSKFLMCCSPEARAKARV